MERCLADGRSSALYNLGSLHCTGQSAAQNVVGCPPRTNPAAAVSAGWVQVKEQRAPADVSDYWGARKSCFHGTIRLTTRQVARAVARACRSCLAHLRSGPTDLPALPAHHTDTPVKSKPPPAPHLPPPPPRRPALGTEPPTPEALIRAPTSRTTTSSPSTASAQLYLPMAHSTGPTMTVCAAGAFCPPWATARAIRTVNSASTS